MPLRLTKVLSQRPNECPSGRTIIPTAGWLFQRPDDCLSAAERLLRHTIPADEYSHELWPRSPLIIKTRFLLRAKKFAYVEIRLKIDIYEILPFLRLRNYLKTQEEKKRIFKSLFWQSPTVVKGLEEKREEIMMGNIYLYNKWK